MPVVVEVKSEADYAAWLADQKAMKLAMAGEASKEFSMDELIAKVKVSTTRLVRDVIS